MDMHEYYRNSGRATHCCGKRKVLGPAGLSTH